MNKKLFLISALLFSVNGWGENTVIEHFSSEQTIKQDFPFSDAVKVGNTIYISGMIGEDDDGNLVEIFPDYFRGCGKYIRITVPLGALGIWARTCRNVYYA